MGFIATKKNNKNANSNADKRQTQILSLDKYLAKRLKLDCELLLHDC